MQTPSTFLRAAAPRLLIGASLLFTSLAHADLLVLNAVGTSSTIFRFDAAHGTRLGEFGHENEGFSALSVAPGEVLVTANTLGTYDLYRFGQDGRFAGSALRGDQARFSGAVRGPRGELYVARWDEAAATTRIARLEGGALVDLVDGRAQQLGTIVALAIGPDRRLYVAEQERGIFRYDPDTGAFVDHFVTPGAGGFTQLARFVFGPDGSLYVSSADHGVYRYRGDTGALVGAFVAPHTGGLRQPTGLAFGPDGHLYVASTATAQVLRFDGATGAPLGIFAFDPSLRRPTDLAFQPAQNVAVGTRPAPGGSAE